MTSGLLRLQHGEAYEENKLFALFLELLHRLLPSTLVKHSINPCCLQSLVVDIGSPEQERRKYLDERSTLVGGVPVDGAVAFEAGVCFSVEVKVLCMVLKAERLEYKFLKSIVNELTKAVEKARCNKAA